MKVDSACRMRQRNFERRVGGGAGETAGDASGAVAGEMEDMGGNYGGDAKRYGTGGSRGLRLRHSKRHPLLQHGGEEIYPDGGEEGKGFPLDRLEDSWGGTGGFGETGELRGDVWKSLPR